MDKKDNQNQPAPELSVDEQLDRLLEQFLAEEESAPPEETTDLPVLPEETTVLPVLPEETTDDLWGDQDVVIPVVGEEIGPDAQAFDAAGLTDPEEDALEQILREALQETEEAEAEEEDFTIPDDFFVQDPQPDAQHKVLIHSDAAIESIEDEEVPEIAEEAAAEEEPDPPVRKRRPKKTNTYGLFGLPHMVTTVIWLALIVFIGAGLGRMIWNVAADMLAFDREEKIVTITITADDDLDSIAQKLKDTGLIRYKGIFKFYGKLANAETKIEPGTYNLSTLFDYNALVKHMSTTAVRESTKVVIPEGYTCAQIFQLLEESGVCSVEKLEEAAMNADLSKYWFLEGVDRSTVNCLEGYLFPDTYEFYLDYDATKVLHKFLSNFNRRFTDTMRERLDILNETLAEMMRSNGLSEKYITAHKITVRELVIIASMIEKETSGNAESYYISSVIYNRLTNPGEYPYLNIDAALVYAVGHSPLTKEDLKFDSPYNTYLYKGLIPGPIANPGTASLNAALAPENTEYYFYALDPSTGSHKFFKTYKAHQAFLESLRNGG